MRNLIYFLKNRFHHMIKRKITEMGIVTTLVFVSFLATSVLAADKVVVGFYGESLCPDCIAFCTGPLRKAFDEVNRSIHGDLYYINNPVLQRRTEIKGRFLVFRRWRLIMMSWRCIHDKEFSLHRTKSLTPSLIVTCSDCLRGMSHCNHHFFIKKIFVQKFQVIIVKKTIVSIILSFVGINNFTNFIYM